MAKRMAGAADYIVPIGLIGVAALVAYKLGLFGGTGGPGTGVSTSPGTGTNNTATNATTATVNQTAYTNSAASTPQIVPDTTLNQMISTMWSDYLSSTSIFADSSYGDDIVVQMGGLGNITDLYRLIQLFGTRAMPSNGVNLCNTLGIDCSQVDFGTFIHNALSSSQLANLNSLLTTNGIEYTFN
jgi:hypothetical protein